MHALVGTEYNCIIIHGTSPDVTLHPGLPGKISISLQSAVTPGVASLESVSLRLM